MVEYFTEQELSKRIKRSVHTLRSDRHRSRGVPYIKLRGQVLYSSSAVDEYMKEHEVKAAS